MDLDSASLIRLTAFTADRQNIILIKKNPHSADASRVLIQTILEVNDRDLGQHEGVEESEAPRLLGSGSNWTGGIHRGDRLGLDGASMASSPIAGRAYREYYPSLERWSLPGYH